jgi:hypothetical protein
MATVDEVDQIRVALMEHAAQFFHDVRTPPELYTRFVLCFNSLREEIIKARDDGRVTPSMAEAWSWYSLAVPAMLSVIFRNPKWGTRELEQELNDTFVKFLRESSTTTISKPAEPAAPSLSIETPGYRQPPHDPNKKVTEH